MSVALNTVAAVSIKRTHEILSGVFNIPIAIGTISNMVKRCADSLSNTVNTIKQKMTKSTLGHFDETGTRVNKKLWWVHNAPNCEYPYLDTSHKRGFKGMEQCGVLTEFSGIAMHDCRASYWNYPNVTHAVCCAYLLRELTGIVENHPEQKWASAFIDLFLEMKKVMNLQQELHRPNKLLGEKEELIASLEEKLSSQEEQNRKHFFGCPGILPEIFHGDAL